MKPLFILSILFTIVFSENVNESPKPSIKNLPNPFLVLQFMPKMIEVIRDRLTSQNPELPIPVVLREIQVSMHATPITDFSPAGIQAWANQILQQIVTQINAWSSMSTTTSPASEQESMDRDLTTLNLPEVSRMAYSLPDLAFDRDPSRKQAYSKIDDNDDDDELGYAIIPSEQTNDEPADSEPYLNEDKLQPRKAF